MDGYRVLESGDLRITESGDGRVTEGFIEGFVSLSGSATLDASSIRKTNAYTTLQAVGSTLLAGEAVLFGRTNLVGSGTKSFTGNRIASGSLNKEAEGTISSSATRIRQGSTSLSSAGSIEAKAGFKFVGASSLSGSLSSTSTPKLTLSGNLGVFLDSSPRITESGDTRITEDGDIRITGEVDQNIGLSSIVAKGVRTGFRATVYINDEGIWVTAVPYVKHNSTWQKPAKTYRYMSYGWKRIY